MWATSISSVRSTGGIVAEGSSKVELYNLYWSPWKWYTSLSLTTTYLHIESSDNLFSSEAVLSDEGVTNNNSIEQQILSKLVYGSENDLTHSLRCRKSKQDRLNLNQGDYTHHIFSSEYVNLKPYCTDCPCFNRDNNADLHRSNVLVQGDAPRIGIFKEARHQKSQIEKVDSGSELVGDSQSAHCVVWQEFSCRSWKGPCRSADALW